MLDNRSQLGQEMGPFWESRQQEPSDTFYWTMLSRESSCSITLKLFHHSQDSGPQEMERVAGLAGHMCTLRSGRGILFLPRLHAVGHAEKYVLTRKWVNGQSGEDIDLNPATTWIDSGDKGSQKEKIQCGLQRVIFSPVPARSTQGSLLNSTASERVFLRAASQPVWPQGSRLFGADPTEGQARTYFKECQTQWPPPWG